MDALANLTTGNDQPHDNCTLEVVVLWPATPFAEAIVELMLFFVEGLIETDPALYPQPCERLDMGPEQCVKVGDTGSRELSGAKEVGMRRC